MSPSPSTPPALGGRDRFALLLSLVPYLLEHTPIAVTEAAAHFGVSPATVRDLVRLVGVSGIPGESATYGPEDLFDIDWDLLEQQDEIAITQQVVIEEAPRFSAREAAALIAGLQYLSAMPGQGGDSVIDSLLTKLTASSTGAPAEVAVAASPSYAALAPIRTALAEGRSLSFEYSRADGTTQERLVDPLRLESRDQDWYLRGWCHLRESTRTFRVDRMSLVAVAGVADAHDANILADAPEFFTPAGTDLSVTLDIDTAALPLVAEYLGPECAPVPAGDRTTVTIRVASIAPIQRLVTGLGGAATVLDPPSVRDAVAAWAQAGLDAAR